jgi:hypothetical protein
MKLMNSINVSLITLSFLTTASVPSYSFTFNEAEGNTEFSAHTFQPSSGIQFGNRLPNEILSPGQNYPLTDEIPQFPVQDMIDSSNVPELVIVDEWNDPLNRGEGKHSISTFTSLTLAGNIHETELRDTVGDNLAVRSSTHLTSSFSASFDGNVLKFAQINISGRIDLDQEDAWVFGSLKGSFSTPQTNVRVPAEIIFAFDGNNRGREDFMSFNGTILPLTLSGADQFLAAGRIDVDLEPFNLGQEILIDSTFTCVAYNGSCEGIFTPPIPEFTSIFSFFALAGLSLTTKFKKL